MLVQQQLEFYTDLLSKLLQNVLMTNFWHFQLQVCFISPLCDPLLYLDEGLILNFYMSLIYCQLLHFNLLILIQLSEGTVR